MAVLALHGASWDGLDLLLLGMMSISMAMQLRQQD